MMSNLIGIQDSGELGGGHPVQRSQELEAQFASLLRRPAQRRRVLTLKQRCDDAMERTLQNAMRDLWGYPEVPDRLD